MSPSVEKGAIDTKQLRTSCSSIFCSDNPPIPPDVKALQDFSAYLCYKSTSETKRTRDFLFLMNKIALDVGRQNAKFKYSSILFYSQKPIIYAPHAKFTSHE
jgi:hypothetical protein